MHAVDDDDACDDEGGSGSGSGVDTSCCYLCPERGKEREREEGRKKRVRKVNSVGERETKGELGLTCSCFKVDG